MFISPVLLMAVCAWAAAQVLKLLISIVAYRRFDIRFLITGGGMPSSHSALVCACATGTAFACGPGSTVFALSAVLAFVVMYDAANVRRETGEQSRILNYIVKNWDEMPPDLFGRELKELLGHTPLQVLAGALLGIMIGVAGSLLTFAR